MVSASEVFLAGIAGAVLALEAAAAVVILVAGARALLGFLGHLFRSTRMPESERRRFARGLLLGLDFTIGSDVLKLALSPTMDGVLVVALVVLVRTIMTLVLEYELRRATARGEG